MISHESLKRGQLAALIKNGSICFGGNRRLKIYGLLSCGSGKRMKVANRVFFASEQEAIAAGYRPCGNCMRKARHFRHQ